MVPKRIIKNVPIVIVAFTIWQLSLFCPLMAQTSASNFGSVPVGTTSGSQTIDVTFAQNGTLNSISVVMQGVVNGDFTLLNPGSCTVGTAFVAGQNCSVDVTFAPSFPGLRMGAVVLADASGNTLALQYISGTGAASQIAFDFGEATIQQIASGLIDPEFLTSDNAGNLYIADSDGTGNKPRIIKIPPGCRASTCQSIVASSSNGIGSALGIAVDGAGNIYISDASTNQVDMIPPGCTTSACLQIIASQANGEIISPRQLAVDTNGDVFIADLDNNRVVEVPIGCTSKTCQIPMGTGLNIVFGVAVDPAGNVFISHFGDSSFLNGQVVKLPPGCTGGSCQSIVATELVEPRGIKLDAADNLYIAFDADIVEVSAADGSQKTLQQGFLFGIEGNPTDIAIGPEGNLFIADPNDSQILEADRVDPPQLSFAATSFGTTSAPQLLTIENIGTQTLDLLSITPGSDTALDPATTTCAGSSGVGVGASCVLGIQFAPTVGGTNNSSVTLVDDTLNHSNDTQIIQVTGISNTSQTITFSALPVSVNLGVPPITLQAVASSGLPVTFTVTGVGASISGSILTILTTGEVTITANQSGNSDFAAAPPVSHTIIINSEGQAINFPALPSTVVLGVAPIVLQASATSGLPVSYSVSGPASISGSTLTILGIGSVTVTATQAGNDNFSAAPPISQTITVNAPPAPDFTITSNVQSLTLSSGQSSSVTVTVTPSNGFNSPISFSCTQQSLIICSFNPRSLTPNNSAATTTLTITSSKSLAALRSSKFPGYLETILGFALSMVVIAFERRPEQKGRFSLFTCCFLVMISIVCMTGCGGGANTGTTNSGSGGTPQTTSINISASAQDGTNHTLPLTITVLP